MGIRMMHLSCRRPNLPETTNHIDGKSGSRSVWYFAETVSGSAILPGLPLDALPHAIAGLKLAVLQQN